MNGWSNAFWLIAGSFFGAAMMQIRLRYWRDLALAYEQEIREFCVKHGVTSHGSKSV